MLASPHRARVTPANSAMSPTDAIDDQLPLAGHDYYDEEAFQRECADVFSSCWHFVAHEQRVASPRDALVATVGRDDLVLRRGADGTLHAFHNICRHRGAPLLRAGTHEASLLRCPYHGWRYGDDGSLTATPGFADAGLPPRSDCLNLLTAELSIHNGLVFVRPAPPSSGHDDATSLTAGLLTSFPLTDLQFDSVLSFDFRCNWKLYVENWLESYHLPWMHRGLARDVDVKEYTVELRKRAVYHHAPRRAGSSVYGGVWLWLWPLTAINSYDSGVSIERIVPVGVDHTHIEYTFLFAADTPSERRTAIRDMCATVTNEDGQMCEMVHASIRRGRYSPGPLSPRHEGGIAYFHHLVRDSFCLANPRGSG